MKTINYRFAVAAIAAMGILPFAAAQTYGGSNGWSSSQNAAMQPENNQLNLIRTGTPTIIVDDRVYTFDDPQPGTVKGKLYIPIRAIADQMGGSVKWEPNTKQAMLSLPNQQMLSLSAGSQPIAMRNANQEGRAQRFANDGSSASLYTSQISVFNGRAYILLEDLATALNGTAKWDAKTGTAMITTKDGVTTVPTKRMPQPSQSEGTPSRFEPEP